MPTLKTISIEDSKIFPGVKYKIRTLNQIRRARRDAAIAAERLEYTRLTSERAQLFKALVGEDGTQEERTAKANMLPPEKLMRIWDLDQRAEAIRVQTIIPSTIRAAVISIENLESLALEDVDVSDIGSILENGPDALIDELYILCLQASQLTAEEAKN